MLADVIDSQNYKDFIISMAQDLFKNMDNLEGNPENQ